MSGNYGIEQIKKILAILVELGNVSEQMVQAKKDGGSTLVIISKLVALGDELYELIGLDFTQLKLEISEIDSADMDDIRAYFIEKFDLSHDEVEGKVEAAIELLDRLGDVIIATIKFAKSFKK